MNRILQQVANQYWFRVSLTVICCLATVWFGCVSVLYLVRRQCLSADLKYYLASPALSPAHQAGALHDRCVGK